MSTKHVVLCSGGGFTGAFQAGAIARLDEAGIRPAMGYGISVGSLNTAMWMQGDVPQLVELWKHIRFEDIFSPRKNLLAAYRSGGLHSNAPLKRLIAKHIDPDRIEGDFYAGLVNLTHGEYLAASRLNGWGPYMRDAILASTSVPVQHTPVRWRGLTLVDGGVWNVSPLGHLVDIMNRDVGKDGVHDDHVIVINCQPEKLPQGVRHEVGSLIDVAARSISLMVDKSVAQDMRAFRVINELCEKLGGIVNRKGGGIYRYIPFTVIQPPHHLGSGMDARREHLDRLFDLGYEAAEKALAETRRARRSLRASSTA